MNDETYIYTLDLDLELIAILPDSQRSGAGTRLVQWGTDAADEQGLQVRNPFTLSSLHLPHAFSVLL